MIFYITVNEMFVAVFTRFLVLARDLRIVLTMM